jgi:drug/metabolite transporter, DME family
MAIALAAALWAVAATAARSLFDDGMQPVELAGARVTVAALGLAIVNRQWALPRSAKTAGSVLAFGLSIALVTVTYYVAIEHLAVAVAVVLQYTAPAMVVVWVAIAHRRPSAREVWVALVLALVGVVFASDLPGADIDEIDLVGIAAGLGSAVCFASYTIFSEKVGAAYGPVGAMFRAFFVAAIFWNVALLVTGRVNPLFSSDDLLLIGFIGVFGTLVPFSLYVWGIRHVKPERAVIAATLEPPFAALVAWIWLGQGLSAMQLAGGALVVAAVVALQMIRSEGALLPDVSLH